MFQCAGSGDRLRSRKSTGIFLCMDKSSVKGKGKEGSGTIGDFDQILTNG